MDLWSVLKRLEWSFKWNGNDRWRNYCFWTLFSIALISFCFCSSNVGWLTIKAVVDLPCALFNVFVVNFNAAIDAFKKNRFGFIAFVHAELRVDDFFLQNAFIVHETCKEFISLDFSLWIFELSQRHTSPLRQASSVAFVLSTFWQHFQSQTFCNFVFDVTFLATKSGVSIQNFQLFFSQSLGIRTFWTKVQLNLQKLTLTPTITIRQATNTFIFNSHWLFWLRWNLMKNWWHCIDSLDFIYPVRKQDCRQLLFPQNSRPTINLKINSCNFSPAR